MIVFVLTVGGCSLISVGVVSSLLDRHRKRAAFSAAHL